MAGLADLTVQGGLGEEWLNGARSATATCVGEGETCCVLLPLGFPEWQEACVQASAVVRALAKERLGHICQLLGVCCPHRHGLGRHFFFQLGGDEFAVHSRSDGRIAGTFDHARQFTRFKLVQRPL
jgi:hypothetical protein